MVGGCGGNGGWVKQVAGSTSMVMVMVMVLSLVTEPSGAMVLGRFNLDPPHTHTHTLRARNHLLCPAQLCDLCPPPIPQQRCTRWCMRGHRPTDRPTGPPRAMSDSHRDRFAAMLVNAVLHRSDTGKLGLRISTEVAAAAGPADPGPGDRHCVSEVSLCGVVCCVSL